MSELDDLELQTVLREAQREAARLHRRLPGHYYDREDFAQDLLLELLKRLPRFDPSRGGLGAFAGVVVRHRGARICMQYRQQYRRRGAAHLPLEQADEAGRPLAEILPETSGLWSNGERMPREGVECVAALNRVLGTLGATEHKFCRALSARSVRELVAEGWGSRSSLYRRIEALRPVFLARGVSPALLAE